jgi:hypothetical protein
VIRAEGGKAKVGGFNASKHLRIAPFGIGCRPKEEGGFAYLN